MKTVTIDELLTWAFVHELPKGGGVEGLVNPNSAWRMISELGTRVSSGTPQGGGTYYIEQGEPADDAVAVGEAVAALAGCDVDIAASWRPLGDWPSDDAVVAGLRDAAVAAVRRTFLARAQAARAAHIVNLVVGQAILGGTPDCHAEPPRVRLVERHGRPAWFVRRPVVDPTTGEAVVMEVDGYDPRRGRPLPNAYRRHELADDPRGDILGRLDYQLWVAALRRLAGVLAPMLVAHRLLPCDLSATPWQTSAGEGVALVAAVRKESLAC